MLCIKSSILNFFILILLCASDSGNRLGKKWLEAQAECMYKGAMLEHNFENIQTETYHWTGFYVRKSRWIKIIGCFRNTTVVKELKKTYIMPISSAGLCQEICIENNFYLFGIQDNKCVCLKDTPRTDQMTPEGCNSKCYSNNSNNYPVNLKFSEYCGGQGSFSVFLSGTAAEKKFLDSSTCLAIQCTYKTFIGKDCATPLARICNRTVISDYVGWKKASTFCKQSGSYLFGDVNLTDVSFACSRIKGSVTGPTWLGVAKEIYISIDRGTYLSIYDLSTFMEKCQKCNNVGCTFTSCSERNTVDCMLGPTIPTAVATTAFKQETRSEINGTMHTFKDSDMVATNTLQAVLQDISTTAGEKNLQNKNQTIFKSFDDREDTYLVIQVMLPIVAVTGIGSVAIAVLLIRRKRSKENKRSTIHQNEHDFIQRPGVHTLSDENCFVHEAAYSSSETTGKSNEHVEYLYNESTDGEYDHLRDAYSKQRLKDNTYDHVSCLERQGSSDYDVTNVHKYPQTDTTYDRAIAFKESSVFGYNDSAPNRQEEDCLYAKPVKPHAF